MRRSASSSGTGSRSGFFFGGIDMVYFFSKRALTDDHYAAIGLVAAEWSVLELAIEAAIIQYLTDEWEVGRIVTVEMGNVARQNAMLALARWHMEHTRPDHFNHITPTQYKALETVCGKIDGLRARRNEAVHAYWVSTGNTQKGIAQHMKVSAKRVLKAELRPIALDDLRKLAEDIATIHGEFRAFFVDELGAYFFM